MIQGLRSRLETHNYITSTPTLTQTFTMEGITDFQIQWWDGASWQTIPGASVSGNNKAWRRFTFAALTTTKVRALVNNSLDQYSRGENHLPNILKEI